MGSTEPAPTMRRRTRDGRHLRRTPGMAQSLRSSPALPRTIKSLLAVTKLRDDRSITRALGAFDAQVARQSTEKATRAAKGLCASQWRTDEC